MVPLGVRYEAIVALALSYAALNIKTEHVPIIVNHMREQNYSIVIIIFLPYM